MFGDGDGGVDLHLPNHEALALQKEADRVFWKCEREQRRLGGKEREYVEGGGAVTQTRFNAAWECIQQDEENVLRRIPNKRWVIGRPKSIEKPMVVGEEEDDSDKDYPRSASAEQDEEIDEELGEQWEMCERALLASEGLRWAEDGKTLKKTKGV